MMYNTVGPVLWILFILLSFYLLYMAIKSPSKFWENFGHNLKVFYLYIASFIGLMLVLFNGITLTKTLLETTVFPIEYEYIDTYACENPRYDTPEGKPRTLTAEEKVECEARQLKQAKENRLINVNRSYAGGIAGLFFGFVVWIPHFIWARRSK